jgi:hypothetical protein
MARYAGLPDTLRHAVDDRDGGRCRWCGATNQGDTDKHHIRYRRGAADDVLENLVSLCRACHTFVHGNPRPGGARIVKGVAQQILLWVIAHPGTTGSSRWRQLKKGWALVGLCEHGEEVDACPNH